MVRVGFAKDIHRLVLGRKLILSGIEIPSNKGEEAHSDGDVVFHALSEAMLGSLALGDLGEHFPSADPKYKNISSDYFLTSVYKMIKEQKYHINNIDISIELEKPKIAFYLKTMRENIARILQLDVSLISVKANSNEGMDATGKGEAVTAYAIVTVSNE